MASAKKHTSGKKAPGLGVYYRSLTVENVRCFADAQTLTLAGEDGRPYHWTLLLGENGTGKTTLLQALAAISIRGWTENNLSTPADSSRFFEQLTRWSQINSPFYLQSPKRLRAGMTVSTGLEADSLYSDEAWFDLDELDEPYGNTFSLDREAGLPTNVLCAYGPMRRSIDARLGAVDTRKDEVIDFLEGKVTSLDVEEWFLQRDYAASSNATEPAAREESRRWLAIARETVLSILPGVTDLVPRSTGGPSGQIRLYAVTSHGTVPFRELGFGMQSTLAWVVDLAVRMMTAYPDSADPLKEPAVCLVDEIDLHLHPRWQRVLLQQLSARFPNVQFVATAHSPLIVQAAPDANVVVLRRDGERVVIDRAPESVRHWRVDQILTSDLFGLPSARPAALDGLIEERERLLAKEKPSAKDTSRLAALRAKIGAHPAGESPTLLEAEELLLELTRAKTEAVRKNGSMGAKRKKA